MVSDKYVAGFVDADGCFDIQVNKVKNSYYIKPRVRIGQKFRKTLDEIQEHFGWGNVRKTKQGYYEYCISGRKAITVANRLKNHLVLKQSQAEWVSKFDFSGGYKADEVKGIKLILKGLRYQKGKSKNFPSRKWLAGYFDGDGCITGVLRDDRNKPSIACMITCDIKDSASLELIHKNFGGTIQRKTKNTVRWDLWLNPTNCEKFIGYFGKHLLLKRYQADIVLDWFRSKHKDSSRESAESLLKVLAELKTTGND